MAREMLGPILLSIHNLTYYQRLLADARAAIMADRYAEFRAAKLAGAQFIPALLRPLSTQQAAEMTIVENLQREDLNCLEQANAYARLSRDMHVRFVLQQPAHARAEDGVVVDDEDVDHRLLTATVLSGPAASLCRRSNRS